MITAFATLVFLITIWLVVTVVAQTVAESGSKIVAALTGHSPLATVTNPVPLQVRVGQRSFRQQRSLRAQPRLRAAA